MTNTELREKLVELLKTNACPSPFVCDPTCRYYGYGDCFPDRFADYLIAHGVTLNQWIPVTERSPDLIPCNAGTAYSEAVIVWTSGKKAMIAVYDGIDFVCPMDFWEAWGEEITHWMPLPEPPKEK